MWFSSKSGESRGPALLVLVALFVSGAALAQLAISSTPARTSSRARSRAFLSATSGIGLGASVSTDWSVHLFDPRIESSCENELWPLPGGVCPNPHHGAGLSNLPSFD